MIGFVTSLRAPALARNWPHHVWLLERTIESMLAVDEAGVVVVCHEVPATPLATHPRVTFLPLSIPVPPRINDDMCVDKVVKVSAGVRLARERGYRYVGICDADDLVSRRLGDLVRAQAGAPGWYAGRELIYAYGGRWLRRLDLPASAAGPLAIIRADLLESVRPPFSGAWVDTLRAGGEGAYLDKLAALGAEVNPIIAAGHMHYRSLLAAQGHPLAPLPFDGHLMINHDDSLTTIGGGLGSYTRPSVRALIRNAHRWVPTLRPMKASLREEFSVPPEIPAAQRGASLFLR